MAPAFLNNKGFTLLEFMVSIVIMTVGLFGLLSAMNVALSRNMETQLRNEAISVLDKEMARELSKGFNNISTAATPLPGMLRQSNIMNATVSYWLVRGGQTIPPGSANPTSKVVNYQVNWTYHNRTYSYNASSVSSQPNL
jgi:type IV pilus assembly protein PilV